LQDKIYYHLLDLGIKFVRSFKFGLLLIFLAFSGFNATLTNRGASGKDGPTSLGHHYTGQDQDGQVTLSSGIQQWTVPYTGAYRIEAVGAAGGYEHNQDSPQYRGRGTRMDGTFNLSRGEIIQILVSQEGGIRNCDWSSEGSGGGGGAASGFGVAGKVSRACGGRGDSAGGGCGGGTFVVRGSNTSLIVAGGGGGVRAVTSRHEGCDANISTSGNPGCNS